MNFFTPHFWESVPGASCGLLSIQNLDALDRVAAEDFVDHVHPFNYLAEDRAGSIEMWLR